eukprot:s1628_g9.t1
MTCLQLSDLKHAPIVLASDRVEVCGPLPVLANDTFRSNKMSTASKSPRCDAAIFDAPRQPCRASFQCGANATTRFRMTAWSCAM